MAWSILLLPQGGSCLPVLACAGSQTQTHQPASYLTHVRNRVLQGNRVAVKMLNLDKVDPVVRGMLYQEAIIMSELRHPCIARVYGLVDEAPYHALVMQYYRRGTLTKHMSAASYEEMSMAARLRLAQQVCGEVANCMMCHAPILHLLCHIPIRTITSPLRGTHTQHAGGERHAIPA